MEVRFNEVRRALDTCMEEIKVDVRHLQEEVSSLQLTRAELKGKASQSSVYVAVTIALLSLGVNILKIFLA